MYELMQAAQNSYYLQSPAKIGLVRLNERDVCLIDSGGDKDAGRRVRRLLDENGWRLTAVYNTHSHADHIGGNAYLQAQTGCRVYAPEPECALIRHPILEPALLYGGFAPPELRHKFLLAQPSEALPLAQEALPDGLSAIDLPGHSLAMTGFRSADDVVYLADCLSSRETLEKYRVCFVYDVAAYLDTLRRVREMRARLFVPAHAEATEDVAPLAQYNIDAVERTAEQLEALCAQPAAFEEILRRLFDACGLTMTFEQYALVGSTVRSYLAWMRTTGRLSAEIDQNRLLWRRA